MKGDRFTLKEDAPDFIWLVPFTSSAARPPVAMYLPRGFTTADARDAMLVTGHVESNDSGLTMVSDLPYEELCKLTEEMLGYFCAPNVPSEQLLNVMEAVTKSEQSLASAAIPLLAYAWLDIVVREDIADKARSTSDLWQKRRFEIDCQATCERRLNELYARFTSPEHISSRMAPSVSTRSSRAYRDERLG